MHIKTGGMSGILRKVGQPLLNSRSSLQISFLNQQKRGFAAGDPTPQLRHDLSGSWDDQALSTDTKAAWRCLVECYNGLSITSDLVCCRGARGEEGELLGSPYKRLIVEGGAGKSFSLLTDTPSFRFAAWAMSIPLNTCFSRHVGCLESLPLNWGHSPCLEPEMPGLVMFPAVGVICGLLTG